MTRKIHYILLSVLFVVIFSSSVSASEKLDVNMDSVINADDALLVL